MHNCKAIVLEDAFAIWYEWRKEKASPSHLDEDELEKQLGATTDWRVWVDHLLFCDFCLGRLESMIEARRQPKRFSETAWPMAAAVASEWPKSWTSADGTFTISISPFLESPQEGLLEIEVAPEKLAELEGKTLIVTSGNGQRLLHGAVFEGRAMAELKNIEEIDLRLLIRTGE